MKAREGDLLKDSNGTIFDVKGLVHPPGKVIAFPRFIPDPCGNRGHETETYKKIYNISARFSFLEQNFPQYIVYDSVFGEKLCEVPSKNVRNHYKPIHHLQKLRRCNALDRLENDALEFLELIRNYASSPWCKMGISGSLLVKLHTLNSDIDPVIYGTRNCLKVHEALKALQRDSKSAVKSYTLEELRKLFNFRFKDTRVPFGDFVRTELRKVLQGKFSSRDYFMRFVKDWNEIKEGYGMVHYENVGYARIKAEVEDDSEAIFTPCSYRIRNVKLLEGARSHPFEEIVSFRGRFCEQARIGEAVTAQGKVEHVLNGMQNHEYFRLLLGNKPSDYMVLG